MRGRQVGAQTGAHPILHRSLLSSAARSSLIAILLLQPVFFLRSRPTRESVREVMVKVMVDFGVRGPLQELALGRLTLNRRAHRWQDHRWPRLATPAHKCCCCCRRSAALQGCCCCNCAAELCKAAGPALRGSSQAPPPSSCDLLLPGLL